MPSAGGLAVAYLGFSDAPAPRREALGWWTRAKAIPSERRTALSRTGWPLRYHQVCMLPDATLDLHQRRAGLRFAAGLVPGSNTRQSVYEYASSHAAWTTALQFRQLKKSKLALSDFCCVA